MKKLMVFVFVLLVNISAWGQTVASYSITSVEIANTTLTDRNWVSSLEEYMSGMNSIAAMLNTGIVAYRVDRLNSLEEQLLQRANAALSNETIRRGETWQVMLDQTPQGARSYTFFFHCESNGKIYYLLFRRDRTR